MKSVISVNLHFVAQYNLSVSEVVFNTCQLDSKVALVIMHSL